MKWEIRLWYDVPDMFCNLRLCFRVLRAVLWEIRGTGENYNLTVTVLRHWSVPVEVATLYLQS
jgi:hypothetical protein